MSTTDSVKEEGPLLAGSGTSQFPKRRHSSGWYWEKQTLSLGVNEGSELAPHIVATRRSSRRPAGRRRISSMAARPLSRCGP